MGEYKNYLEKYKKENPLSYKLLKKHIGKEKIDKLLKEKRRKEILRHLDKAMGKKESAIPPKKEPPTKTMPPKKEPPTKTKTSRPIIQMLDKQLEYITKTVKDTQKASKMRSQFTGAFAKRLEGMTTGEYGELTEKAENFIKLERGLEPGERTVRKKYSHPKAGAYEIEEQHIKSGGPVKKKRKVKKPTTYNF